MKAPPGFQQVIPIHTPEPDQEIGRRRAGIERVRFLDHLLNQRGGKARRLQIGPDLGTVLRIEHPGEKGGGQVLRVAGLQRREGSGGQRLGLKGCAIEFRQRTSQVLSQRVGPRLTNGRGPRHAPLTDFQGGSRQVPYFPAAPAGCRRHAVREERQAQRLGEECFDAGQNGVRLGVILREGKVPRGHIQMAQCEAEVFRLAGPEERNRIGGRRRPQ